MYSALKLFISFCLFISINACIFASIKQNRDNDLAFEYIAGQWLTMSDGIKLSVNYWKPRSKKKNIKFPIILEALPYRKDDVHFIADYTIASYFARHGIGYARVDVRGTGSSQGRLPNREYSDIELKDIKNVIYQLSKLSWCNGKIGMQGISWGAFNSIMTALQHPAHLKGILIAHGSEDLYSNDIHYIDGALHVDIFTLEMDTDNIFPQSPSYKINKSYYINRFNRKPWIFTYLHHQKDGPFWQSRSLYTNYNAIKIPVFAFASLLDGYRDFAINMLQHVHSPIGIIVGPQTHAWPDWYPGPRYEWRALAVKWWKKVFDDKIKKNDHSFIVFLRDAVKPNIALKTTPGSYIKVNWPIKENWLQYFLHHDGRLLQYSDSTKTNELVYKPNSGNGVLNWWGEITPDMRIADSGTLIYESEPIKKELYLMGKPIVSFKTNINAHLAHWIVRLEDVSPDGSISFITGGLKNGAHIKSRTHPVKIKIGKTFLLTFPLRFTTWKFTKGHKIRLTVSNAQFPMIWPTPFSMMMHLHTDKNAYLKLPIFTISKQVSGVLFPKVENDKIVPDASNLGSQELTPFIVTHEKGYTKAFSKEGFKIQIHKKEYESKYQVTYMVNDTNPADATFDGLGIDSIRLPLTKRIIKVQTQMHIHSDKKYFHTSVNRSIFENHKLMKKKSWKEDILRDFQ